MSDPDHKKAPGRWQAITGGGSTKELYRTPLDLTTENLLISATIRRVELAIVLWLTNAALIAVCAVVILAWGAML